MSATLTRADLWQYSQDSLSQKQQVALELLKRQSSKDRFDCFVKYTKPDYDFGWVHEEICEALQQFLEEVENKKSPRLIIMMPPQEGKTELVSRRFPAFALGKNPNLRIVSASYSSALATEICKDVVKTMSSQAYKSLFGVRLNERRSVTRDNASLTSQFFNIVGHKGYYRSIGVGGGLSGFPAEIAILDDAYAGITEGKSPSSQQHVLNFHDSVLSARVQEGGGIIVVQTRWDTSDIIGTLLAREKVSAGSRKWKVIRYPSIATSDEKHRKAGEGLSSRFSIETRKAKREELTADIWEALHQQNPTITGGNLFKLDWFAQYESVPPMSYRLIVADTAQKTGQENDYSVLQHWGKSVEGKAVLIEQRRGRWQAHELERQAIDFYKHCKDNWHENASVLKGIYIEDKASGIGLIQNLQLKSIPVIAVPRGRGEDKVTRANNIIPSCANGLVWIPKTASWRPDFDSELVQFPAGSHDDQVDCLIEGVTQILMKKSWWDNAL